MKPVRYEMEELLPLVAKLAAKYTSGESTSVPYETANMLMEAVCYCIEENEREGGSEAVERSGREEAGEGRGAVRGSEAVKRSGREEAREGRGAVRGSESREGRGGKPAGELRKAEKLPAAESYRLGFERVLEKTRHTQERYNELIADFQDYGNGNYRDAVLKALPEFFMKYDPRFAPQETMIGLDYPTLRAVREETGIDAVERYVAYIALEQRFFRKLPEGMAEELLTRFHEEYRELYFNLCNIPLRHMLAAGLLGRQPGQALSDQEYAALGRLCGEKGREALTEILNRLTEKLVVSGWGQDQELLWYLRGDTADFAAELTEGLKGNGLKYIVA